MNTENKCFTDYIKLEDEHKKFMNYIKIENEKCLKSKGLDKLIIDDNTVYEIDEECIKCNKRKNHMR